MKPYSNIPWGFLWGFPWGFLWEFLWGSPQGKNLSHSHSHPMGMGIPMGIPIPTATLVTRCPTLKRTHLKYKRPQVEKPNIREVEYLRIKAFV